MELLERVKYEPRPFRCGWPSCNKSFKRKSGVGRHYRIHTNEPLHRCSVLNCGKAFIQRSTLIIHSRTHTGDKPYHCQHKGCDKRFSDPSTFARHCRIHTGLRPFKCAHNSCFKSFSRKIDLVEHQHRSHRPSIHPNEILDDRSSDFDMREVPSASTQMTTFRPVSAIVPGQCMLEGLHWIPGAATFPDFNRQVPQYNIQNAEQPVMLQGSHSLQQPFYVAEPDKPGVATLDINTYLSFQDTRGQTERQSSALEMPYAMQGMTLPAAMFLSQHMSW